jgi:hypothetical protein
MTKRARVVRLLRPLSICNFVERKLNFIFVWFAWGGGGATYEPHAVLNAHHSRAWASRKTPGGFEFTARSWSEWSSVSSWLSTRCKQIVGVIAAWKPSISRVGHYSIARALFSKCILWHFVNLRTIIENGGLQQGWKSLHVLLTDVVWWWNISQAWSDCCRVESISTWLRCSQQGLRRLSSSIYPERSSGSLLMNYTHQVRVMPLLYAFWVSWLCPRRGLEHH